tara:strand:- start:3088 stop:3384 length:297 start_codon:yes stop_codon:yes gene_type:complete
MKQFITINGKKAWITERNSMEDARQSAINICDHSKEVVVREIEELTDHTKVFENKPSYYNLMKNLIDETVERFDRDPLVRKFGYMFLNDLKRFEDENN